MKREKGDMGAFHELSNLVLSIARQEPQYTRGPTLSHYKLIIFNILYRRWMWERGHNPIILYPMLHSISGSGKTHTVEVMADNLNMEDIRVFYAGIPILSFYEQVINPPPPNKTGYFIFFDHIDLVKPNTIEDFVKCMEDFGMGGNPFHPHTIFIFAVQRPPDITHPIFERLRRMIIIIPKYWWYDPHYLTKTMIGLGFIKPEQVFQIPIDENEVKEKEKFNKIIPGDREKEYLTQLFYMLHERNGHEGIRKLFEELGGVPKVNDEILHISDGLKRKFGGNITPDNLVLSALEYLQLLTYNYPEDFVVDFYQDLMARHHRNGHS